MKFSTAAISIFAAAAAMAVPLGHEHNIHKRDVVTEVVHQTLVYYQKQVVYVDQNGTPYSTGVQIVSTAVNDAQPASTEAAAEPTSQDAAQNVASSAAYVAPSSTFVPESSAPTSTAPQSTSEPAPQPTTSSEPAQVTSSEPASTTLAVETSSSASPIQSSAAAASSSAASSSSGGSGSNAGDGTFYATGLGACGITSTDSDYIVAISHARFDAVNTGNPNNNPLCGKQITAYRGGKSVKVTVVDRCPGCDANSLDFSPAAFNVLGDESEGRISITWDFD
jgi:hypothetical protein